ncbi:KUP/HAK/KT family potassium transporter [Leifsonia xyli]|uniref:KUP/HAK/KT family potassium transporter n=1 Tax=Leifsonia xyli TaxID=1575 RepID=UPI000A71A904
MNRAGGPGRKLMLGAALAALGVVFGDIGTSPLYALKTVFLLDGGRCVPIRTTCTA